MRVRLVDCVGYTVEGAAGYEDEEGPRMVSTPWFEYDIPFQEAAELGTRKVISDHSTIGWWLPPTEPSPIFPGKTTSRRRKG